jgi:hypothetical protein
MLEHEIEIRQVDIGDFETDLEIQRPLDRAKVDRIKKQFDPNGIGVVEAWEREPNHLVLVDGQHRIQAARDKGYPENVDCKIHIGITKQDAAELFLLLNNTSRLKPVDQFLTGLTAGRHAEIEIAKIVMESGYQISRQSTMSGINGVESLRKIYFGGKRTGDTEHPDALRRTLQLANDAWKQQEPVSGHVFLGIGYFMLRFGEDAELQSLAKKLGQAGGPNYLLGKGREAQSFNGGTVASNIGRVVHRIYNSHKSTKKLPEW